jgi:tetratricopeptide (TPR) repeat protein
MKKTLLILSAFLISMTVFGQKDELKAAQKAIDAKNYAAAITSLNQAEGLIANAEQKEVAQYYYLNALALYKNGAGTEVEKINDAFKKLISYETETKVKYTPEIQQLSANLASNTANRASTAYKTATQTEADADYALAAKDFYLVYVLSPTDTMYLDNAALIYNKAKDYKTSSELYEKLLDLNYTGISTSYIATNKDDGQDVVYNDEKSMNMQVKLGLAINPRTELNESRRNIIYKYLAENYVELGEMDKALEVIAKGREEFPTSYELLISEANIYFKKGNNAKFKELLEEAIRMNPTDPNLYYNVGVMNLDQKNIDEAMRNFEKAIELKPDFAEAYQNMGTAIIDKTLPIVEEMNNSLNDFNKYDKLQAKQFEIYREALPYYEKAYELNKNSIGVVQTLLGLYENLEMEDKLADLKVVYEGMKE